jgi:asparagine synthase (glutamine-hydrolysing)
LGCGICGFVGYSDRDLLVRMRDTMVHRGPDEAGELLDPPAGLAVRRLSIIDLSTGSQPIANEDDTIAVASNGEIYNYRELSEELTAAGHRFRTRSDVEAIVHLYEDRQERCVHALRGMFAFAIWDRPRQRLLLARDRIGIKPLYYTVVAGKLLFASEIKALLECDDVPRRINPVALDQHLALQYAISPATIFAGIHKLPPGHLLSFEDGKLRVEPYCRPDEDLRSSEQPTGECRSDDEILAELGALTREAVESHLVSDVPVGSLLSGGVDSGVVTAYMAQVADEAPRTFTVGFDADPRYNELDVARRVAEAIGAQHHETIIDAKAAEVLPSLIWHLDEPIADAAAVPTFFISRFARKHVTVVLTGEGGDEFHGGYPRYFLFRVAHALQAVPAAIRERIVLRGLQALPLSGWHKRTLERVLSSATPGARQLNWIANFTGPQREALYRAEVAAEIDASALSACFGERIERVKSDDIVDALMQLDAETWLPEDILIKVDKVTMATSLESRVPLLDNPLVDALRRIPAARKVRGRQTKYFLRRLADELLPAGVAGLPKHAFIVPIEQWLRTDLRGMVDELLLGDPGIGECLRVEAIRGLVDEFRRGEGDHAQRLWNLLCLELWHKVFIAGELTPPQLSEVVE